MLHSLKERAPADDGDDAGHGDTEPARARGHSDADRQQLLRFEARLCALANAARLLPALTVDNAHAERERLVRALRQGRVAVPRYELPARRVSPSWFRLLDSLRRELPGLPCASLYGARLDELELDLLLLDALGRPRLVRPLAARRYGTGAASVTTHGRTQPLARCARAILDQAPGDDEARDVPAAGAPRSLSTLMQGLAAEAGLDLEVRVEPRLAAGAATGERVIFVADRLFGQVEAWRLAVHEVLGHLLVSANARAQPLGLLRCGTADSFVDQEGLALCMEQAFGVLDTARLRTLAARVLATDLMHAGASFGEAARRLHEDEGFCATEAVVIAERAFRGGGVARDAGYLLGLLRVSDALACGAATLDELRLGRVGVCALPELRELRHSGLVREPAFRPDLGRLADYLRGAGLRPNFSRSLRSTSSGTTPLRSPPSDAASLIRLELTKK